MIGIASNASSVLISQNIEASSFTSESVNYRMNEPYKTSFATLFDHNRIVILSNADFTSQASAEGWTGDGTLSAPYIIEKFSISSIPDAPAIYIRDTDVHFRIQHCALHDGNLGLSLNNVQNGYIYNNTVYNNEAGIILWDSSENNVITSNIVCNQDPAEAIGLHASDNNLITDNIVYGNAAGILLWDSSTNNVIVNNSAYGNELEGIGLHDAFNNTVIDNDVYDNQAGIFLWQNSHFNLVVNNSLSFNSFGMSINSNGNNIINNSFSYHDSFGLEIEGGDSGNTIEGNNFFQNNPPHQAFDRGFDNEFKSNYWDDWTTPDIDADGIVDTPYPIYSEFSGEVTNQDSFPLTSLNPQTTFHVLFLPSIIYPKGGETLKDVCTIEWTASNDSSFHSITYSVYYSNNSGESWIRLATGLTTTTYEWDTNIPNDGSSFLIKVEVSCSEGLTKVNLSDSVFSIKNHLTLLDRIYPFLGPLLAIFLGICILVWRYSKRRKPTRDPYSQEMLSEIVDPGFPDFPYIDHQEPKPGGQSSRQMVILFGCTIVFFGLIIGMIVLSLSGGFSDNGFLFISIPGLLFILIFGIGLVSLLYSFLKSTLKGFTSRNWPTTEGTIESSRVTEHRDSEGGRSYSSHVSYSYTIHGERYHSNRVKFGLPMQLWKGRAQKTVNKYPVGISVRVYVDPNSPENAVLEPGMTLGSLVAFLVFGLICLFGFIFGLNLLFSPF